MTDLGESIRARLAARDDVRALVVTGSDVRITTDALPQDEILPAIVFYEIDDLSHEHVRGAVGHARRRYQFDCFGSTRRVANAVRETVRLALQGYRGQMAAHFVRGCTVVSRSAEYEPPTDGSDHGRYLARIEFFIDYVEPIPAGV